MNIHVKRDAHGSLPSRRNRWHSGEFLAAADSFSASSRLRSICLSKSA
jgi:hypothetical protein